MPEISAKLERGNYQRRHQMQVGYVKCRCGSWKSATFGAKHCRLSSVASLSRVCAVAQYAVLEANGKVNGIGEISDPPPPKPLDQIGCGFKYMTKSPKGVDVQNLVKIDSAVAALRMREKNTVSCGFFLLTYLSIYLPVLRHAYRSHF